MRTNPRPTPDTMGYYYPKNHGPYIGPMVKEDKKGPFQRLKRRILKPIIDYLFQINVDRIPNIPTGQLLEIGCASGAYMHKMHLNGWEVSGVEFSNDAAKTARSPDHDVFCGRVEDAPAPEKPFDMVVSHMIIEHLHDPVLVLKKLKTWTKQEGWLIISIPNAQSKEFNMFKDKWYALQLPTHTYHFTSDTITKLLEKCGWEAKQIYHHRLLNNILCSIVLIFRLKGYYNRITIWLLSFPQKS